MKRRNVMCLYAIALLVTVVGESAMAQAPSLEGTASRSPRAQSVATANVQAGIASLQLAGGLRLDTAAVGTATHRRPHAAKGAMIGAIAGAGAGIVAADLIFSAQQRHPDRHGYDVDTRPSARYYLMGIFGILGAGAGALAGATLGALIP